MSLLGIMILIGYQSEMGSEKYAWEKEGSLYYPAFIYPPRHCIPETANDIYVQTLWFGDHDRPSIYWGPWESKHLHIAITCVARAMCGVTETDCSPRNSFNTEGHKGR